MERTIDPDQVGIDPARLAVLDAHFARYVDDGRLAGWQLVVSRGGEVAHATTYGVRDLETGRAGRAGHAVAHLLDDQADHVGRRDDAVGGGPLRADRRDQPVAARVRRRAGVRQGLGDRAGHGAGDRADPGLAPADAHVRPDLRAHDVLDRSTRIYRAAGFDFDHDHRRRPRRRPAGAGRRCRCCSSPARSGATRSRPTCSAASSRSSPGRASPTSAERGSSSRSA